MSRELELAIDGARTEINLIQRRFDEAKDGTKTKTKLWMQLQRTRAELQKLLAAQSEKARAK